MFPPNPFTDELGPSTFVLCFPKTRSLMNLAPLDPFVMYPQNSFIDELGPSTLVLCFRKTHSLMNWALLPLCCVSAKPVGSWSVAFLAALLSTLKRTGLFPSGEGVLGCSLDFCSAGSSPERY